MATSLKATYDTLKKRYEDLTFQLAGLLAKKKMMEEQLLKVDEEITQMVGNKPPDEVLCALQKEVETRSALLQEDIAAFEKVLAEFKIGVIKEKSDMSDILKGF
jgi:hypothetical protein